LQSTCRLLMHTMNHPADSFELGGPGAGGDIRMDANERPSSFIGMSGPHHAAFHRQACRFIQPRLYD
jgi:hypothetical protein